MDTRRDPRSGERRDATRDVSTDTVRVELVDLQSVGKASPGSKRGALIAVGVLGILAFAALGPALQSLQPSPSQTAPGVALASPMASPLPSPTPGLTPRPTARPTLRPTPTPAIVTPAPTYPWTWTRNDLGFDEDSSLIGMWPAGDHFLGLWYSSDDAGRAVWSVGTLPPGDPDSWQAYVAPPAMDRLWGANGVEDRLWALAQVSGVSSDQTTWQLVSTTDGVQWLSLGPAQGLGQAAGSSLFGRVASTWVANLYNQVEGEGPNPSRLVWSSDGVQWHDGTTPAFPDPVFYIQAGLLGDRMVVLGSTIDYDDLRFFVFASADGSSWSRTALDVPANTSPGELVCQQDRCVLTLYPTTEPTASTGMVMVTTDGQHWATGQVELPMMELGDTLRFLQATSDGFLAMAGGSRFALLTSDGLVFQVVEVMPADSGQYIADLAVNGDLVLAYAKSQLGDTPDVLWEGSLAAMATAP